MFKSFLNREKNSGIKELIYKLLFVFGGIMIFRIGAHVPVPGLDALKLAQLFDSAQNNFLTLFDVFSGGALSRFTVFALGIMPYISAAIIMQLLTSVSVKLGELKKEGESGQIKINEYTKYMTLILATIQAIGISKMLISEEIISLTNIYYFYFIAIITLVTGTMFLVWLGEQITEYGIGNGISILIFAAVLSEFPSAIARTLPMISEGQIEIISVLLIILLFFLITYFVVFIESALRNIPLTYPVKQQGRRYSSQKSNLPLKLNMAGVIPPIFATSIILFAVSLAQWFSHVQGMEWLIYLGNALQEGVLHVILFTLAIFFFCFFYTALVFNPKDTADNLKKSGAFIGGTRPGLQTANYIDYIMTRLTFLGAIYLVFICLMPRLFIHVWNVPFYFGGTSLLIVVVVMMDFFSNLQANFMAYQYQPLFKKFDKKKKKRRDK